MQLREMTLVGPKLLGQLINQFHKHTQNTTICFPQPAVLKPLMPLQEEGRLPGRNEGEELRIRHATTGISHTFMQVTNVVGAWFYTPPPPQPLKISFYGWGMYKRAGGVHTIPAAGGVLKIHPQKRPLAKTKNLSFEMWSGHSSVRIIQFVSE